MGLVIHARRRHGEWKYRLRSTSSDTYVTPPLNEAQLAVVIAQESLVGAGLSLIDTADRFERARASGSSAYGVVGYDPAPTDLDGDWEACREPVKYDEKEKDVYDRKFSFFVANYHREPLLVDGKALRIEVSIELVDEGDARKALKR